jgi:hypothetical protein
MPWDEVMHKYKTGELHSGSKKGPKVKNRKQAIAIMLSEKRKAKGGKDEYKSKKKSGGGALASMLSKRYSKS